MPMNDEWWKRSGPLKNRKLMTAAELRAAGLCARCRKAKRTGGYAKCDACRSMERESHAKTKRDGSGANPRGKPRSFAQFERENP